MCEGINICFDFQKTKQFNITFANAAVSFKADTHRNVFQRL